MLFKNIGLIDENFEYRSNMYVGTNCHRIVYIDSKPPENEDAFFETYDGTGKVLMPAFYNAHGHSPMSLMRGYGENLPLDRWLNERIFPFEDKLYSEGVYWATMLRYHVGKELNLTALLGLMRFLRAAREDSKQLENQQ